MTFFSGSFDTLTFILLMCRIGRAPNNNPIYSYIQQEATLHSLLISGNCCTCFGWFFHTSSGAHTTVSTAAGICRNTVTVICRYRGRVGTYATHSTFKPVPTLLR
jgi:drug/metabolite transporter (DMT)-like permease